MMKKLSLTLLFASLFLVTPLLSAKAVLTSSGNEPVSDRIGGGKTDSSATVAYSEVSSLRNARQLSQQQTERENRIEEGLKENTIHYGMGVWQSGFAGLALPSSYHSSRDQGLVIQGIEQFPDNRILVFDSQGQRVYSQRGYSNGWKGTDRQGKPLPSGTYFIIVEVDGLGDDLQAYLSINR